MIRRLALILSLLWLTSGISALTPPAAAQGLFTPAIIVNNDAITYFELEQRELFLTALRLPGNAKDEAEKQLIEDRLKSQAAEAAGIRLTSEGLEQGLSEFASRANLTTEEFIKALAEEGVEPETFRAFVESNLLWREVIRTRFAARARLTEAEVERALALSATQTSARILVSEIILPLVPPERAAASRQLANELQRQINTTDAFAAAARQYSVAPTRTNGGRRDWLPLANLPPQLAGLLLTLGPGEVSEPVPLGDNALGLFQVRALEETRTAAPTTLSVDYVTLLLPLADGLPSGEAERLRGEIDVCDDLFPYARDLSEGVFSRQVQTLSEVPRDIALELANLDPNEVSGNLRRGGAQLFVMLCGRTTELAEGGIEQLQQQLFNERLSSYSESYLSELRADAIIRR